MEADFIPVLSSSGKEVPNLYSKNICMEDLDYLYNLKYSIKYAINFFRMANVFRKKAIENDLFVIEVGLEDYEVGLSLGFLQVDKFLWRKTIGRKDIEALKVIETPLDIFANQGIKERVYEGKTIDAFFATI